MIEIFNWNSQKWRKRRTIRRIILKQNLQFIRIIIIIQIERKIQAPLRLPSSRLNGESINFINHESEETERFQIYISFTLNDNLYLHPC